VVVVCAYRGRGGFYTSDLFFTPAISANLSRVVQLARSLAPSSCNLFSTYCKRIRSAYKAQHVSSTIRACCRMLVFLIAFQLRCSLLSLLLDRSHLPSLTFCCLSFGEVSTSVHKMDMEGNQANGSGPRRVKGVTQRDEQDMAEQGKKQVFHRNFGFVSMLGFTTTSKQNNVMGNSCTSTDSRQ